MNIFGLLAAGLLLAVLQTAVYRLFGTHGVRYRRYFTANAVYEGQRVELVEEISNAMLLPVPWLKVEARMSRHLRFKSQENLALADDSYHRSLFTMGPWRKITRTHTVTCVRRGCYTVDTVALSSGDLFGLGERQITVATPMELIVYPRILDFTALNVPSRRWQGDVVVRRTIEPDPFLVNGIRPYLRGDSLRDVHWAATARTGSLKVKTRDFTANPRLLLVVNVQLTENQWGDLNEEESLRIEQSLSLAATYAEWALRNGVETGFLCNGRWSVMDDQPVEVPVGGGRGHLTQMLEAMARLRIIRRRSFHQWLDDEVLNRGITGMDMLVISHYWSPNLEERAGRLRRMENSVTWVNPAGGGADA